MLYRFTLIHEILGTLIIPEPGGWREIQFKLSRNSDFKSLWETFEGEFIFYGTAIERIRTAINTYGPDTTMTFVAEVATDGFTYQKLIQGQLALDGIQETDENTAVVPIIKTDLTTKFKNRYDTPVDILSEEDLDGNTVDIFDPISLDLPSQKIQRTTTYTGEENDIEHSITPTGENIDADGSLMIRRYYHQATVNLDQDEIIESADTLLDWVLDPNDVPGQIELEDESGEVTVTVDPTQWFILFSGTLTADSVEPDPSVVDALQMVSVFFLQKNAETPISLGSAIAVAGGFATPTPGSPVGGLRIFNMDYAGGSTTIDAVAGDSLKVYVTNTLTYTINVGADTGVIKWGARTLELDDYSSVVTYAIQSTFRDTNAEAFLLHDVAGQISDRIVGESQKFYSALLGSSKTNYKQYDDDGCQWRRALIKGLQLRQYTLFDKPFFLSFKQWWEGINPILNLGLGYETVDGEEVLRVESAEYFFDETIIVRISNVKEIVKSFDPEQMVKTVRIGYKQWQSENISGIDDPQTKHTYASRLQKFGVEKVIESDFIAASLAIETTRRTTKLKSADYKFDDNTFIIALSTLDGSPDTVYLPERDENFSSITNLRNAETRYNSIFTPARNFMRWAKSLFGGLQHYVGSVFKFTSGEGNYDMTSNYEVSNGCDEYNGDLSEKQSIEVTDDFIHRGEQVEIKCKLEIEDYLLIKANLKNAVGISQTSYGHLPFHIKDLSYPIYDESTIIAWAVQDFQIRQLESVISQQVCAAVDECEDAYLTEGGDEFITQDNQCLVLN